MNYAQHCAKRPFYNHNERRKKVVKKLSLALFICAALVLSSCASIKENFGILSVDAYDYPSIKEVKPVRSGMRVARELYPIPNLDQLKDSALVAAREKERISLLLIPPGSGSSLTAKNNTPSLVLAPSTTKITPITIANKSVRVKQIQTSEGNTAIRLNVANNEKAWDIASKAATSAGYHILDRDTTAGAFYILDTPSTGGLIKRETPIYQVLLINNAPNTVDITLLQEDGVKATPEISAQILSNLMRQLN
jgi:hypothetical protein